MSAAAALTTAGERRFVAATMRRNRHARTRHRQGAAPSGDYTRPLTWLAILVGLGLLYAGAAALLFRFVS